MEINSKVSLPNQKSITVKVEQPKASLEDETFYTESDSLEPLIWQNHHKLAVNMESLCSHLCEYSTYNAEVDSVSLYYEQNKDSWNSDPSFLIELLNLNQIAFMVDLDLLQLIFKPKGTLSYTEQLEVAAKLPIAVTRFAMIRNDIVANQGIINSIVALKKDCAIGAVEEIKVKCLDVVRSYNFN